MSPTKRRTGSTRQRSKGSLRPYLLRLPERLHAELRVYAATQRRSMNAIITEVLEGWWQAHPLSGQVASMAKPEKSSRARARLRQGGPGE
jgi:plasmid stability protein